MQVCHHLLYTMHILAVPALCTSCAQSTILFDLTTRALLIFGYPLTSYDQLHLAHCYWCRVVCEYVKTTIQKNDLQMNVPSIGSSSAWLCILCAAETFEGDGSRLSLVLGHRIVEWKRYRSGSKWFVLAAGTSHAQCSTTSGSGCPTSTRLPPA